MSTSRETSRPTISYFVAEDWEKFTIKSEAELCDRCTEFFAGWEQRILDLASKQCRKFTDYFSLYARVQLLKESVRSGCPFCEIILLAIKTKFPEKYTSEDKVDLFPEKNAVGWAVRFRVGKLCGNRAVDISSAQKLIPGLSPAV
jgi:hypothetical protein